MWIVALGGAIGTRRRHHQQDRRCLRSAGASAIEAAPIRRSALTSLRKKAPPGICGDGPRRRLLQRFQSHERRRNHQGAGVVPREHPPDPRRQGQRQRLYGPRRSSAPACKADLHNQHYTAAKIESQIVSPKNGGPEVVHAETLENAIRKANAVAQQGDVVLLAPACASFDQFKSYEHRGKVFKEIVRSLASDPQTPDPRQICHPERRFCREGPMQFAGSYRGPFPRNAAVNQFSQQPQINNPRFPPPCLRRSVVK